MSSWAALGVGGLTEAPSARAGRGQGDETPSRLALLSRFRLRALVHREPHSLKQAANRTQHAQEASLLAPSPPLAPGAPGRGPRQAWWRSPAAPPLSDGGSCRPQLLPLESAHPRSCRPCGTFLLEPKLSGEAVTPAE